MLSQDAIKEYRDIFKKKYGFEISEKEAKEQAIKLLILFKSIYIPIENSDVAQIKS